MKLGLVGALFVLVSSSVMALDGPIGKASSGRTLGRLGQTLLPTAVYAAPNIGSERYYEAKQFEYFVLRSKVEGWWQILLNNGSVGYVMAADVTQLPYQVKKNSLAFTPALRAGKKAADFAIQSLPTAGRGMDSGGFVTQVMARVGLSLPKAVEEQVTYGSPITRLENLKPGDRLYFWSNADGKISSTAIYIGHGYAVGSNPHEPVQRFYVGQKAYLATLVAARR